MGGTKLGTRVCGRQKLSGNGSAGGTVDRATICHWRFACRVEGSGGDEAWRVPRVDW